MWSKLVSLVYFPFIVGSAGVQEEAADSARAYARWDGEDFTSG